MTTEREALTLALEALTYCEALNRPVQEQKMHAITAIKEALAQPEQEPVDFASLLREAEEIVQSKPTWKRFIDGTPLANDIAVWMAVFAQDVARRTPQQQRPWVGLTGQEKALVASVSLDVHDAVYRTDAKLKDKNT